MIDTAFATVTELAMAYRDGTLTPVAAVTQSLARLAQWEPRLNAFAHVMGESARGDAERLTAELASGHDRGPLHGVPVAIKDLIEVAGEPTGYGSKVRPPAIANEDATLVSRLRAAGAIIIGKTNLLEYAYGIAHPLVGQTNNPWHTGRTSGGSSGGSAAAVAAGIVPLAIGTDTGGSIRIPASYCGIVGLKPRFAAVSLDGVFPLSTSLDHAGPLARTVADAGALLGGMTGRAIGLPIRPASTLRVGVLSDHLDSGLVTPGVRAAVTAALDRLTAAGATVERIALPGLEGVNDALMTVLLPEAALIHEALAARRPASYAPGTAAQIAAGRAVSGVDYLRAQQVRSRMASDVDAALARIDVLLSPAVAFVAPREDPALDAEDGDGEMLSSGLANLTGHPAVSLPCGLSDGLPVGLQLIAATDASLLGCAVAVEAALAFEGRPDLG